MDVMPYILKGNVMHARLLPRKNRFTYRIYYLVLPLALLSGRRSLNGLALERFSPLSFYSKDHGARLKNTDLQPWINAILTQYGFQDVVQHVTLISLPRVLGYVFNPVSFWLCLDQQQQIRAVVCEVHNTFGEQHSYLCAHPDHRPILAGDIIRAEKLFHVSPFLEREGYYTFRFVWQPPGSFGAWIDFYEGAGQKTLLTSLTGRLIPMSRKTLRQVFWTHPMVTLKAIMLIHWQALKIISKGIAYIKKPLQLKERVSTSENITKM